MHKIEVVVQRDQLSDVSQALRSAKAGAFRASGVTVYDPAETSDGTYRGASYSTGRQRVKVELVVSEAEVESTVEAILRGLEKFGKGEAELVVLAVEGSVRRGVSD
jgi:nitrogen regulatory protein PII